MEKALKKLDKVMKRGRLDKAIKKFLKPSKKS
jgi:hypothetical protein